MDSAADIGKRLVALIAADLAEAPSKVLAEISSDAGYTDNKTLKAHLFSATHLFSSIDLVAIARHGKIAPPKLVLQKWDALDLDDPSFASGDAQEDAELLHEAELLRQKAARRGWKLTLTME